MRSPSSAKVVYRNRWAEMKKAMTQDKLHSAPADGQVSVVRNSCGRGVTPCRIGDEKRELGCSNTLSLLAFGSGGVYQ